MSRLTLLLCLFGLTCSQVFAELGSEAIVGGVAVKTNYMKYFAKVESNGRFVCGGAIIDSFHILTAAQCVVKPPGIVHMHPFKVKVGTNILNNHEGFSEPVEIIYVPKAFSFRTGEHDIAILKLKNKLDFKKHQEKIDHLVLPRSHSNFVNDVAHVSGFGFQKLRMKKNGAGKWERVNLEMNGRLMFANAKIISNEKCSKLTKTSILPTWICAQTFRIDKKLVGTCKGDSGGPLVFGNQLIGILSKIVFNCDESNHPAIYTRVSSYMNMINNIKAGKPGHDVLTFKVPL